jgi:hypothetical protein
MPMHPKFREAVESLHSKYEALVGALPYDRTAKLPLEGVYLFCEHGKPLYVGRSKNIPQRRGEHCNPSSGTNKAALARLIACDELGLERDYGLGRDKFKKDPRFDEAFRRAKSRVALMEFRAVPENDPARQALLEVYCAVAGEAKFNSFETH